MNVALIHEELTKAGYDVVSVNDKGECTFATPKNSSDMLAVRDLMLKFKEPTREELAKKILSDRDRLIDQLLLERFLPPEINRDAQLLTPSSVRPV